MKPVVFAILGVLAITSSGCFTLSTAEVRVRDTRQVSLESTKGEPLVQALESDRPPLAPSPVASSPEGQSSDAPSRPSAPALGSVGPSIDDSALVDSGGYWRFFEHIKYEIRAQREPAGNIALRCDACAEYGAPHVDIVDASGAVQSVPTWSVEIDDEKTTIAIDDCMVHGSHSFCDARAQARLVVPTNDIVEVRRKSSPIRPLGYLFAIVGGLAVTAATVFLLTPSSSETIGDRAPFAAIAATPFAAVLGLGLWEIFAPVHETVWKPQSAGAQ